LDYDVRQNYSLEIIAYDKGIPSLSGTATVEINVINSNDKAPYFMPTTQRAEVSEDAEVNTFVHQLTATDPDISSLDLLEYSWDESLTTAVSEDGSEVPASHMFSEYLVINKTGAVTVNKKLRRDLFAVSAHLSSVLFSFKHFIPFPSMSFSSSPSFLSSYQPDIKCYWKLKGKMY
jgi:hypothetical protein